jgi:aminoglycoside phosphotransferase (APT) family kinase protein
VCARKMHEDQVDIDADLVRRLLRNQFPEWGDLPLEYFDSGGTVNAIYRLGSQMYVRLPLTQAWVWHIRTERKWLPRLAPELPLPIPEPLAHGEPDEGYPYPWAVYRWIEGEPWRISSLADLKRGGQGSRRVHQSVVADRHEGRQDPARRTRSAAPIARRVDGPSRWVHNDLLPGNVLIRDGRMHAVIDFGGVHLGDPAIDMSCAWKLLEGDSRQVFREALDVDDPTWARARGWAIPSVGALHYYRQTNPAMVEFGLHTINEVLADLQGLDRP